MRSSPPRAGRDTATRVAEQVFVSGKYGIVEHVRGLPFAVRMSATPGGR